MSRTLSVCSEPGCGELTVRGRCPDCERAARGRRERHRESKADRGYPRNWRRIRANFLRAHERCECDDCLRIPEFERPVATVVDHRDGDPSNCKFENLRAMTKAHHDRRTARDQPGGWHAYARRERTA